MDVVKRDAVSFGIGIVAANIIDEINILEATRLAMRQAIGALKKRLEGQIGILLVDGHLPLPNYAGEQWPLVKGDSRSHAIAAASILAKVTRDRLMVAYDSQYPGYGFAGHKGYGTKAHRNALGQLGPSPIHRQSFKWRAVDE